MHVMATFTAVRSTPELVAPARPTRRETKALSDVDDQRGLRFYISYIHLFRRAAGHRGIGGSRPADDDPAKAVRAALAEALVYYYPMAGRLRERPGGKLVVDCTAEGVVFVEADADATVEELRQSLVPPYPCAGELLCDAGDPDVVIGKPLVYMQVTRLRNEAFAIGVCISHSIVDGFGAMQFLEGVADIAQGEAHPAVLPVWDRETLMARDPPRVTRAHLAYEPLLDASDDVMLSTPPEKMVSRSFVFGPEEIAAVRSHVVPSPPSGSSALLGQYPATTFELLAAVVWRCRTRALRYAPHQAVRIMLTANARGRSTAAALPLQQGFYGNAALFEAAEVTAGTMHASPLGQTVSLLRDTKRGVAEEEYVRSWLDMMAERGRPHFEMRRTFMVTNLTHIGGDALDYGLGECVAGGPVVAHDTVARLFSSFRKRRNNGGDGSECVEVTMCLPSDAMERFQVLIEGWTSIHLPRNPLHSSL